MSEVGCCHVGRELKGERRAYRGFCHNSSCKRSLRSNGGGRNAHTGTCRNVLLPRSACRSVGWIRQSRADLVAAGLSSPGWAWILGECRQKGLRRGRHCLQGSDMLGFSSDSCRLARGEEGGVNQGSVFGWLDRNSRRDSAATMLVGVWLHVSVLVLTSRQGLRLKPGRTNSRERHV
jgi:hypothetical protein